MIWTPLMRHSRLFSFLFALALAALQRVRSGAAESGGDRHVSFSLRRPMAGNRIASIAGVPGDINTYYAGAAAGGIFKSSDGGFDWTPIFDNEPVAAIGSLAVAPTNPDIVWAGTGEAGRFATAT